MVQINKRFIINYFYLFPPCSHFYQKFLIMTHLGGSGDINKNPGPKRDFPQTVSIDHWNLKSLVTYNFTKSIQKAKCL